MKIGQIDNYASQPIVEGEDPQSQMDKLAEEIVQYVRPRSNLGQVYSGVFEYCTTDCDIATLKGKKKIGWVQCDLCRLWLHTHCMRTSGKDIPKGRKGQDNANIWACPACQKLGKLNPLSPKLRRFFLPKKRTKLSESITSNPSYCSNSFDLWAKDKTEFEKNAIPGDSTKSLSVTNLAQKDENLCIPLLKRPFSGHDVFITTSKKIISDHKLEYHLGLTYSGLLLLAHKTCIRYNDGPRMIRHWRYRLVANYVEKHPMYTDLAARLLVGTSGGAGPCVSSATNDMESYSQQYR